MHLEHKHTVPVKVILIILLLVGTLVSSFLWYKKHVNDLVGICDPSGVFDCGTVNASPYATLDGVSYLLTYHFNLPLPFFAIPIPVAALAVGTLFLVLCLTLAELTPHIPSHRKHILNKTALAILAVSALFSFYLIYIQKFVLGTWCLYCLLLDACIFAALILSYVINFHIAHEPDVHS